MGGQYDCGHVLRVAGIDGVARVVFFTVVLFLVLKMGFAVVISLLLLNLFVVEGSCLCVWLDTVAKLAECSNIFSVLRVECML